MGLLQQMPASVPLNLTSTVLLPKSGAAWGKKTTRKRASTACSSLWFIIYRG